MIAVMKIGFLVFWSVMAVAIVLPFTGPAFPQQVCESPQDIQDRREFHRKNTGKEIRCGCNARGQHECLVIGPAPPKPHPTTELYRKYRDGVPPAKD